MPSAIRRCTPWLVVAIASASFADAADASRCDDQPVRLTAVWYDVAEFFPDGGAGAALELQRRFCELGVNTAWRRASPGDLYGDGTDLEIAIAVLWRHPLQSRTRRPIMGEVPETWSGPGPRPVRVYVEGVLEALGLDPSQAATALLMPLAVGRVATHEMVHALAPGQGHARTGLMSSRLGREALVGAPPAVLPVHVSAVRAALGIGTSRPAVTLAGRTRLTPLMGGDGPQSEG